MLDGINLGLMIGPAVPMPVSQDVINALTSVEVTARSEGASLFQLKFTINKNSPLLTLFLLAGGASIPLVRVVIYVTIGGQTEVLIDGVMTDHQLTPGASGASPTLTITGEDLTRVMDYIDFTGIPYPAMPPEARVLLILAKYLIFGVVPMVIPSILLDVPIPIDRIPRHEGKDLGYIKGLADDVGYVFYIEPGPAPGSSIAYWGPEIRVGTAQSALNVDMDAYTNVDSVTCAWDNDHKEMPILLIMTPIVKVPIPIPIPDITPLSPPLGVIPPFPKKIDWLTGTAKLSPIQAALIGIAKAAKTADAASAKGTVDVLRYGQVLKPRRLVGLRGVGQAFDGLYFIKSVTNTIKRGEYKQSFTAVRNGLVSTVSSVPV
jgi:hypothetical protein